MPRVSSGRVGLKLPADVTASQRDELTTFTCACTDWIDRVARKSDRWSIALSWTGKCFIAVAVAFASEGDGGVVARGSGRQPAFAIWDALSQIEVPLRRRGITS